MPSPENEVAPVSTNFGIDSSIVAVLDNWRNALDIPAVNLNFPKFQWTTSSSADIVIFGTGDPESGTWCGGFHRNGLGTNRHRIDMGPGNCGDFGTVLQHEFAHAIGFTAHEFDDQDGVSTECVFRIAQNGPDKNVLHENFCQHEIEYIYQAFGQRQGGFNATAFWDRPIVTGLSTMPGSVTIDQGQSAQVTPTQLRFTRGQWPSSPLEGTTFQWGIDPPSIATVSSSGMVTGAASGSGSIVMTPSNLPAAYIKSTQLAAMDHRVPLVVKDTTTPPPPTCSPGGTLRVTAISVDQEPAVTAAGTHTVTAFVAGCTPPVMVDWRFDPSAPGLPTSTMLDRGTTVTYSVPAGSYSLSVRALPHYGQGGAVGFPLVRSVNVCTSGGGAALIDDGGAGTQAKEGCGGGGIY